MQSNNNSMNNNQMSHDRYHHNTAQLQVKTCFLLHFPVLQHFSFRFHQAQLQQFMSGSNGGGDRGNNVGNNYQNVTLSELPEPPMSINDIGPIPPPAMFSTPSPTMAGRQHGHGMGHQEYDYDGKLAAWTCTIFSL